MRGFPVRGIGGGRGVLIGYFKVTVAEDGLRDGSVFHAALLRDNVIVCTCLHSSPALNRPLFHVLYLLLNRER